MTIAVLCKTGKVLIQNQTKLRRQILTFIVMSFMKCVSNTLHCFLSSFKILYKAAYVFERTEVAALDFKICTKVHCDNNHLGQSLGCMADTFNCSNLHFRIAACATLDSV